MIRCIAVDDEQLLRDLLEDSIDQVPFLQLTATCKNAMEACNVMQREPIDLIFLDIQMPGLNGLQFLASLKNPPMVILVTAYEQYALEGFNLQVVDYLLKPFSFERFLKACNRANELFLLQNPVAAAPELQDFFVNVEYTQVKIIAANIDYIEGLKDYIKIYLSTAEKPILTRMTMKAMEEKFPAGTFIRCHKSFLVAAKKISTIKRDFVCIGKKEIPVSESYKDSLSILLKRRKN